jgi:YVTN family beta-propeller protein
VTRLRSFLAAFLLAVIAAPFAAFAQPFAYVPNNLSHNVSVIDLSTSPGTVVTTVETFWNNPQPVAVSPDGSRVYIGSVGPPAITVIETTTNTVVANYLIAFPPYNTGTPTGMALDETGARLFVATDDATNGHKLVVLNAKTGALMGTPAAIGANPDAVAYSASTHKVYVTHLTNLTGADTVDVVDVSGASPATKSTTGYPIPIADGPTGIAVSPSGDRIYVASSSGVGGTLSVINTTTDLVTATTAGSDGVHDVAVNTASSSATFGHVFVTSANGANIDEFAADGSAIGPFGVVTDSVGDGTGARVTTGIAIGPDGLTLVVVNNIKSAIERYPIPNTSSTATGTLVSDPSAISPSAHGNFIGPSVIHYTPNVPKNVSAVSNFQGQATVSFDPPDPTPGGSPAVGTYTYTVTSSGAVPHVATGSASPITITGLTNDSAVYTFTVFATSTNGDGVVSAPTTGVTPLSTVPDAPTGVTAVAGLSGHATISFTPPANDGGAAGGIDTYHVVSSPGGFLYTGSSSPITAFSLTNGTAYTFTVTAHNSRGDGAVSTPSNSVTPTDVPSAPLLTGTTAGDHQVTVAFNPPLLDNGLPVTSYTVTASPGPATATGTGSPITVTGLTNLTPYTFTVTATNADGTGPASNVSSSVQPFQPPGPPTNVSAAVIAIGAVQVQCTAPAVTGDAPITLYRVTASPGNLTTFESQCPITAGSLTPGTSYTFTVAALTSLGDGPESAPSNAVVAATAPGAPTNVIATPVTSSSISVAFTPPASDGHAPIAFYNIRSNPATTTLNSATSPATMIGLVPGTQYTFTVSATNAAGEGPQSTPSNSTAGVALPPTNITAFPGDGNALVTFQPPAAVSSQITSATATSSPGGIVTTIPYTGRAAVRVTGLTNGTAYSFTITLHHQDGSSETSVASNPVTPAHLPARLAPWAYIPSEAQSFVAVIDTATDQVINTIDTNFLTTGVAVSSDGSRVYVASAAGVQVIDTAAQAVIANIPIAEQPFVVAVDPSGAHVYTANGVNGGTNSVSVIDTSTNTVTNTIALPDQPYGLEVDPSGNSLYVGLPLAKEVVRIDTATKTIAATSAVLSIGPGQMARGAGDLLYVADLSGQLATMSASALTVQSTTALAAGPFTFGVAVDPASGNVFFTRSVPFGGAGMVNELGGATTATGASSAGISITPTGGKLYVCNQGGGSVSVVDSASMTVTSTIAVGLSPLCLGHFIAPADQNPPRLGAISTRMRVLTGDNVLIGGFVIGGSTPKTVVVRARGPSLAAGGVANPLSNPFLQVVFSNGTVLANDDWQSAANAAQIQASGFAPSDPRESVVMATLQPGPYTAIVSGAGGAVGVGIVEVFEVDQPDIPLAGISTRGEVLTGDDVMIGGVIIQGDAPQTVVVRARGPSLVSQGVANPLSNPFLQLVASDGTVISNDDWQSESNAADIQASGFAPADPRESAILITLNPGAYTAIVSGVGGATGVGIVEVYTVTPP